MADGSRPRRRDAQRVDPRDFEPSLQAPGASSDRLQRAVATTEGQVSADRDPETSKTPGVKRGRAGAASISGVVDLLALVGYATTPVQVALWDLPRRVEGVVWAGTEALRASGNPIQRHPALAWLPDPPWQDPFPWRGPSAAPPGRQFAEDSRDARPVMTVMRRST